jgi:hypothetical protein
LKVLLIFQRYRQKVAQENSAAGLFTERLVLPFRSARTDCPDCQAPLQVYKTQDRTVHTLHLGGFTAHETLLQCGRCPNPTVYAAQELDRLVPSGCTFGYDVLVAVGKALFLRDRRAEEIVEELSAQHVRLSLSEVGYLGKKFVVYLALAHRQSAPRLQGALRAQGGYILHLDGTCEGRGPMLMSSLDSLSQIVLGSVKVPSEKTEQLIPFLKEIKVRYGVPLAAVHDMGAGILAAVKEVFPGVPDFICHFHFLRDVGKDLLESDYDAIRQRLRKHGLTERLLYQARRLKRALDQQPDWVESFCQSVQGGGLPTAQLESFPLRCAYSLIQWTLEGKREGEGYGFPFDRPHVEFAKRLRILGQRLEQIKDIHLRGQWADNKPLLRLSCDLQKLSADGGLQRMLAAIEVKVQVFDRLRRAMRIAEAGGAAGLNSGSDPLPLGPIQKAVETFRQEITSRSDYDSNGGWKAMIEQIDKYHDKLFADPIAVQTAHGPLVIQPQRTNNIMERFFRDFRRGARRRTGQNSISRFLQSMIADTPLVRNLENPRYLKILLQGQLTLEERFAQIDIQTVRKELRAAQVSLQKVPSQIRKLIAVPTFPETISRLFQKAA